MPVQVVSGVAVGGPAIPIVVVTDNRPRLGGPAMPVVVVPSAAAGVVSGAPPIPVYVVGDESLYTARVLSMYPSDLIAYWSLSELAGPTAFDRSAQANNGTYAAAGVTYNVPGIGDGKTAVRFSGADTYVQIGSAAFGADWNGNVGSAICWAQARDAGIWTDGLVGWWMHIRASDDVDFNVVFGKSANNTLQWRRRSGTANPITSVSQVVSAPIGWQCMGMTWNLAVPEIRAYLGGQFIGASGTGFTSWAAHVPDSGNITLLAAGSLTLQEWFGQEAHAAIWANRVLSDTEMAQLGVL